MEPLNILIIDSITDSLKIALSIDGKSVFYDIDKGFKHLESMIPTIDKGFKELGATPAKLDMIGVCCGPGSFTGIRIGIASTLGLAFAGKIKSFGFSFFDIYRHLFKDEKEAIVAPIIDARKSRYYTSLLEPGSTGGEMLDLTEEELFAALKSRAEESGLKVILTGRDSHLLLEQAKEQLPLKETERTDYSASDLLDFAGSFVKSNTLVEPEPIYLRKSEAEIALLKRKELEAGN